MPPTINTPVRSPTGKTVRLALRRYSAAAAAADLVRWFQLLCLNGSWKEARPKALRWEIFYAPGRLVYRSRRRIVRLLDGWPTAEVLLGAYKRIALLA